MSQRVSTSWIPTKMILWMHSSSLMTLKEESWDQSCRISRSAEKSWSRTRWISALRNRLQTLQWPCRRSRRRSTRRGAFVRRRKLHTSRARSKKWRENWAYIGNIKTRWVSLLTKMNDSNSYCKAMIPRMLNCSWVAKYSIRGKKLRQSEFRNGGKRPHSELGSV